MNEVITIGVDLAKNVFQVHGVDAAGETVIRRQLRRSRVWPFFAQLPGCLVGMAACATAPHWRRQLMGLGHEVKLMPARYVKPYVKRGKNDAADAAAICAAVTRPTLRIVAVKGTEQQSVLMLHRTRELLVRQPACAKRSLGFAQAGEPCWSTRSAPPWPSSASSRRSASHG